LLGYRSENNLVRILKIRGDAAKNVLAISFIIILIVETKLFSDLYLAKFLDISVKPFFPCNYSIFLALIILYYKIPTKV